jgi:hypothetical protein
LSGVAAESGCGLAQRGRVGRIEPSGAELSADSFAVSPAGRHLAVLTGGQGSGRIGTGLMVGQVGHLFFFPQQTTEPQGTLV